MLNFEFLEKGLGIVSPPPLCINFQEKCFSCFNLLTDQISQSDCFWILQHWVTCVLQLFLAILGNMCIAIVSCDIG